ncbi:hypothetical protein [Klebsiella phage pKP-M186-2.2]|nr:hypothetical protein [Klebsiella phage pKP-M186-2.2]
MGSERTGSQVAVADSAPCDKLFNNIRWCFDSPTNNKRNIIMRMNEVKPFTPVYQTKSEYVRVDTILSDGGKVWRHRVLWSNVISKQTVSEDYAPDCLQEALKTFEAATSFK